MKKKILLDSYALLAYLNKESEWEIVRDALKNAQKKETPILMNEMNVGETYYILYRKRGAENAEFFLDTVLAGLPITIIGNNYDQVIAAAKIKAQYPLSFADCFAVAAAYAENAVIMTGDPEFKHVENLVTIHWLKNKK